jgi:hypothetical protein
MVRVGVLQQRRQRRIGALCIGPRIKRQVGFGPRTIGIERRHQETGKRLADRQKNRALVPMGRQA